MALDYPDDTLRNIRQCLFVWFRGQVGSVVCGKLATPTSTYSGLLCRLYVVLYRESVCNANGYRINHQSIILIRILDTESSME